MRMTPVTNLAKREKIDGQLVRRAVNLPGFKVLAHDGFKIQFEHHDTRCDGKNSIHLQFVRYRGEIYRIGMMARRKETQTVEYEAQAIQQVVLRNAPGKFEGKLEQVTKPLPAAFSFTSFASEKCPHCKRHWKSHLKKLVFERSNQPGEPVREGPNVVYFFHHWEDDPKGEGLFGL